jgi:tetratricopeptide (TPR) repeat protein
VGGVRPAPTPAPPLAPGETVAPTPPAQPGSNPGATTAPPAPVEPVPIKSLATGVQAKGLHDLLASAEDLMRQEKYTAALDKYNAAQEVAPNNPLITLGRANAELAASYYRRAETDLRDALAAAPHLVQAQFDLKNLAGADRLQIVVKDLKELAANNPDQARPLLLLAYIAYNTGNQDQAATYLDQAEKRTQGDDSLLKAWRQNWNLPKAAGDDANK